MRAIDPQTTPSTQAIIIGIWREGILPDDFGDNLCF